MENQNEDLPHPTPPLTPPPVVPHPPLVFRPPFPVNLELVINFIQMILPEVEVRIDYRLYLETVFEVVPRYKRIDLAVYVIPIVNPLLIAYSTNLTVYQPPRRAATVEAEVKVLIRELIGDVTPPFDLRPPMKIISWNC